MKPGDLERRVVLQIEADGATNVLGSLILVEGDDAWLATRPGLRPTSAPEDGQQKTSGAKRYYWKRARRFSYSHLVSLTATDEFPRLQFVPEQLPDIWGLTDAQFLGHQTLPLGMSYQTELLSRLLVERDAQFHLIEALVGGRSLSDLLNDTEMDAAICRHAAIAGRSKNGLWTSVNRYIQAGADKRGLIPLTLNCGAPGKKKYFTSPSGRATNAYLNGRSSHRGFLCSELDRINCRLGWGMFMKGGSSIPAAYHKFREKFYAKSIIYLGPNSVVVKLLPMEETPSINQFEHHGRGDEFERAPALIGISTRARKNNVDGHRGTAQSGIKFALQMGVIDSTSDDQNLCSEASTLLMLQSTWTTRVIDARTEYCFGEYTSFERVSPRTHIAAVIHAATPKKEWARRFGYELADGDWHHGVFAGIRADNGEGKSYEATEALEEAGIDMMFTEAWHARAKNICELDHLLKHKLVDWRIPGSTMGKLRQRGDKLKNDSPFNFTQFQHQKIKAVLYRNNIEAVPHLLTVEMRRHGVEATRKAIFEFLRETGQIKSAPFDLASMYPYSLPRIDAQIRKDGIHLWDPREPTGRRRIPDLVYWSEWLWQEGYLTRGGQEGIDTAVALDSVYIGRIWVFVNGKCCPVDLQTQDCEKLRMTLVDWLAITDDDGVRRYASGHAASEAIASINASIAYAATTSKTQRARELQAKKSGADTKRARTREEIGRQNIAKLGISTKTLKNVDSLILDVDSENLWPSPTFEQCDELDDPLMDVRASRKSHRGDLE